MSSGDILISIIFLMYHGCDEVLMWLFRWFILRPQFWCWFLWNIMTICNSNSHFVFLLELNLAPLPLDWFHMSLIYRKMTITWMTQFIVVSFYKLWFAFPLIFHILYLIVIFIYAYSICDNSSTFKKCLLASARSATSILEFLVFKVLGSLSWFSIIRERTRTKSKLTWKRRYFSE